MAKKAPSIKYNEAGGIDLLVERDSGNEIRILTGSKPHSKKFWKQIRDLSSTALEALDLKKRRG